MIECKDDWKWYSIAESSQEDMIIHKTQINKRSNTRWQQMINDIQMIGGVHDTLDVSMWFMNLESWICTMHFCWCTLSNAHLDPLQCNPLEIEIEIISNPLTNCMALIPVQYPLFPKIQNQQNGCNAAFPFIPVHDGCKSASHESSCCIMYYPWSCCIAIYFHIPIIRPSLQ